MREINIFLPFSLFLSLTIFGLIYGYDILNPTYDAWIFKDGYHDIIQHYMGWLFYRQSPWHFPIGLIDNLAYPYQFSMIYTDSIPILAVFFKSISFLLPDTFQYFGIWALFCLFLTSFLSSLIIFKLTKNIYYSLLCSIFFILFPVIYQRMFSHTALGGQWILLFGLYLCVFKDVFSRIKLMFLWCIVFMLAISIHAYFVPMLGFLLSGYALSNFLKDRKIFLAILDLALPVFTLFFIMWVLGAFYFVDKTSAGGFGYYSANLNTLFYSAPISIFAPNIPNGLISYIFNLSIMPGQYEGYGYLGLGILVLSGICLLLLFKNIKNIKIKIDYLIIIFILLLSFCYALSNNIYFNETKLLSIVLNPSLEQFFSTFRASGRFIWLLDYSLLIIIFYFIYKNFKKSVLVLVFACLCLQCYDLKDYFIRFKKESNMIYQNDFLSKLPKGKNIVICDSPFLSNIDEMFDYSKNIFNLAYYAYRNSTSINDFYIARKNEKKILEYKILIQSELNMGKLRDDAIYVFTTDYYKNYDSVLDFKNINGYMFGWKK